jgi:hypothetical protein
MVFFDCYFKKRSNLKKNGKTSFENKVGWDELLVNGAIG